MIVTIVGVPGEVAAPGRGWREAAASGGGRGWHLLRYFTSSKCSSIFYFFEMFFDILLRSGGVGRRPGLARSVFRSLRFVLLPDPWALN